MMVIKLMGNPQEVANNVRFFTNLFGKKTTVGQLVKIFEVAYNASN